MTIVIPTNKTAVGASPAPIRAELAGSRCCSALGISVNASAPVLALARQLTCSGFDPKQILEVYRGSTLCFRMKLAAAAPLAVRDNSPGTPVFVPLRERTMRTASPVAPNHPPAISGPVAAENTLPPAPAQRDGLAALRTADRARRAAL